MNYRKITVIFYFLFFTIVVKAQFNNSADTLPKLINPALPKEYEIGGIVIEGADHLDPHVLTLLSGLTVGDKVQVPGEKFSTAIENLWKQGLFEDVKITATKIQGNYIFLKIIVLERPRLSKFSLKGVTKSEADDIRDKINLTKGKVVTDGLLATTEQKIKDFFVNKGYMDTKVTITQEKETKYENSVIVNINVDKGSKIRIQEINITGNNSIETWKLRRTFKETKRRRWWNPFNSGKYDEDNYAKDKKALIAKYNEKGYRDAKIVKDSMYRIGPKRVNIDLTIDEGHKYYFGNVTWAGNSKYTTTQLSNVFGIKKGDVYDQTQLDAKLFMNPNGNDISSLYMDEGYLFFNITPVEVMINNDTIDLEMRIYEGKQATINKVTVSGNTKTNDRVIMREIRTRPGQLFKRSDIIRTQRELSQLGYFDAEKMGVTPVPNQATGTVDIDYQVEEKPSDQIELSGGYGGGRIVGTLGVSFNNFSGNNFFKKGAWRPLPSGDGQRLSVRAQTNGLLYQSYNISFTEPWLGGKKPNSLSVTAFYSMQNLTGEKKYINSDGGKILNPNRQTLNISGVSVGLGKRLKWPDDFFTLYQEVNYQYYVLNNYNATFLFNNGFANNIYYKLSIQRNSIDKPIFETRGSQIALTGQWTPPYSAFNDKDYGPSMSDQQRYKFVEYQKYKFTTNFFTPITNKRGPDGKEARNLILRTAAGFGFLTSYNNQVGMSPFERFYLGGSGLTGYSLDGREIIALRGYSDQSLSPTTGATFITKYTAELRYPVTLNPQATIYVLGFTEAGNSWTRARDFNPFNVKRSAGVGVRVFLPMFGLIGFDYGWRLDAFPGMTKGQFHFTIGAAIGEL
jgi:outer membrane protein insertion porin family